MGDPIFEPDTVYKLDADGDTILTLQNPNASFAEPERDKTSSDAAGDQVPKSTTQSTDEPSPPVVVNFLLSSRHLILASTFFEIALKGTWREASKVDQDGRFHICADDWDADALLILMLIIHGRNRSVPKSIDLETLGKIAALVDYYQCHEAVEMFSKMWIAQLRSNLPTTPGRDLAIWVLVSSVFQQPDIFREVTKVATHLGTGPFVTFSLPIQTDIVDAIDKCRIQPIATLFSAVADLEQQLRKRERGCSFDCSAINLGALLIGMHSLGRLSEESPTYAGYSIDIALKKVEGFQNACLAHDRHCSYHRHYQRCDCTIQGMLQPCFSSIRTELTGLELENFVDLYTPPE